MYWGIFLGGGAPEAFRPLGYDPTRRFSEAETLCTYCHPLGMFANVQFND
jgi:hypothetical protein